MVDLCAWLSPQLKPYIAYTAQTFACIRASDFSVKEKNLEELYGALPQHLRHNKYEVVLFCH
jgi:hypothetical protein